jgi:hypothetical protein
MEKSMGRMLVETVVKKALMSIRNDPERGIRNLVDMGLQFSEGRFQKDFFTVAQTMLQNENSAYYNLVGNVVKYTDTERLFTFGMNVGYNGCTEGAQRIRSIEKIKNCNIPWTILLQLDTQILAENQNQYDTLICDGEGIGIYIWMLFALDDPQKALALAERHPDSAFCIFCDTEDLSAAFLDEAADLNNIMLVVRYEESAAELCSALRDMGLLYSVWYQYGQRDTETIINGDLFSSTQQLLPAFTALVPDKNCSEEVRRLVYQTVKQARNEQIYSTIVWELQGDSCLIDSIISGDACSIYFDKDGDLCDWNKKYESEYHNLFRSSLIDILTSACPKEAGESV